MPIQYLHANDDRTQTTTSKVRTMTKVTVRGRNGYDYDATPVKGELYIVGKFIVEVIDGKCERTICKATKANVAKYSK